MVKIRFEAGAQPSYARKQWIYGNYLLLFMDL